MGTAEKVNSMTDRIYKARLTGDLKKAEKIAEEMLAPMRKKQPVHENAVDLFVSFDHALDEHIYRKLFKPTKNLRPPELDYGMMLFVYGNLMTDLNRLEDAERAFREACLWTPMMAEFAYQLGEVYRITGRIDDFRKNAMNALQISYENDNIARGYCDLGLAFIEEGKYNEATAMFEFSALFDEPERAHSGIDYIMRKTGKKPKHHSSKEIMDIMCREGVVLAPTSTVIEAHMETIQWALSKNQKMYAYDTANNLFIIAQDQQVKELAESIRRELWK